MLQGGPDGAQKFLSSSVNTIFLTPPICVCSKFVRKQVYVPVCVCTCAGERTQGCNCIYIQICIHIYIYTYIYKYIHVSKYMIYIYIHTWTSAPTRPELEQCAPTWKSALTWKSAPTWTWKEFANLKRVRQLEKVPHNQQIEKPLCFRVASDTFWSQSWIAPLKTLSGSQLTVGLTVASHNMNKVPGSCNKWPSGWNDCQGGITCTSWLRVTNQQQAMWWCRTQRNNGKQTDVTTSKLESPGVKDNSHRRRWGWLKIFHSVCFEYDIITWPDIGPWLEVTMHK